MRTRRYTHQRGIFGSAGWLFADLLLALTIIFIAMSAIHNPETKAKQASIQLTPTAIPNATPTPTPTQHALALNTAPLTFSIQSVPTTLNQAGVKHSIIKQVNKIISSSLYRSSKVGFVITLGGGGDGVANAESFNAILKTMAPFKKAVFKNYHDLNNPSEEFDLEVYFLE